MSVGSVGSIGSAGGAAGQGSIGEAASAGGIGASSAGQPVSAGTSEGMPAAKSSGGSSFNNSINITQMSTQNFVSLHNGCQQTMSPDGIGAMGASQEGGMNLKEIVEMMMMMMLLKMMQDMMQQMSGGGAGGMMGG